MHNLKIFFVCMCFDFLLYGHPLWEFWENLVRNWSFLSYKAIASNEEY